MIKVTLFFFFLSSFDKIFFQAGFVGVLEMEVFNGFQAKKEQSERSDR